jgi:hypothetical protein
MIGLVLVLIIDISIVKVYDLIDKAFISQANKLLLFSINSAVCLALQFTIIYYLQRSFRHRQIFKALNNSRLYRLSFITLSILGILFAVLIFQEVSYQSYKKWISILVVLVSYLTAMAFITRLSLLFVSWYRSTHNVIVLLYFVSMVLIVFNLLTTALITCLMIMDRPENIKEFVGGSVNMSARKYSLLNNIYSASSIMSFASIWLTTALLLNYYREKLVNAIAYWLLLSIPLFYFLVNYLYPFLVSTVFSTYMASDPLTISIILTAFLSLSKPIGGLTFAIAFWKISSIIAYEKNTRVSMMISGWGILLIFGANQALVQTLTPYPPFGLVSLSVLILGSFIMLLGIYNSAVLVSVNNSLRKSIHKQAMESKLLGLIGEAEMSKVVEKTVNRISRGKNILEKEMHQSIELDENELKKYIDFVIREVHHKGDRKQNI